MKREPLSGASAFPRRRRGRTLVEPLEARVLYSADPMMTSNVGLSPLLGGTAAAAAAPHPALFSTLTISSRQVEVATVQATGTVGPFVRIDVAQLAELRADAAQRREDLFQKAAERSSLLWSPSNDWSPMSPHGVIGTQPGGSSNPGGEETEAEALARFHAAPRATSRIEQRAALAAKVWNRAQSTPENDPDADGELDAFDLDDRMADSAADIQAWKFSPAIAVIHHGEILFLPEPWEVDYGAGANGGDIFSFPTGGSVYELSNGSAATDPHVPTRFASAGTDSSGAISSTSAEGQLYFSGDTGGGAQQLVTGGHARSGSAGKSRSPVSRAEDEEDGRRFDSAAASVTGAAGARGSRSRDSVVGGDGDASLIGGQEARGLNGGGGHGQNSLNSISTTSSLLGGGAAADPAASPGGVANTSIVVAANGMSSVAAVGASWVSRAASRANFATGVAITGAWMGARRVLEMARDVATAVEGVAAPLFPEAADVAAATGSATAEAAPAATPMLLGLAPVWNWGGGAAHDAMVDPDTLAEAWRMAAAGSLVVTLAGCWYCATATRRAVRVRRRLAERARFATARRIRFNPRPV